MNARPVKVFMAMLLFLSGPAAAASWEDESKEWEKFSSTRLYKDPGYAAKLSLNFIPVDNGHFYVGEVGKGVWFSLGQTVSVAVVAVPVLGAQSRSRQKKDPTWTTGMAVMASAGLLSYLGLKVWSAFDAAEGARRYNARQEAERQKQGWLWETDGRRIVLSRRW
jgi:hypothetical protein